MCSTLELANIVSCQVSRTVCETGMRKAVKPHKATGSDAIPARLLKDYAAEIAPVGPY